MYLSMLLGECSDTCNSETLGGSGGWTENEHFNINMIFLVVKTSSNAAFLLFLRLERKHAQGVRIVSMPYDHSGQQHLRPHDESWPTPGLADVPFHQRRHPTGVFALVDLAHHRPHHCVVRRHDRVVRDPRGQRRRRRRRSSRRGSRFETKCLTNFVRIWSKTVSKIVFSCFLSSDNS
jgi:hypothetical protein